MWYGTIEIGRVSFVLRRKILMSNEIERWVGLSEIAEHLGVSKDTIRNWIKRENIPFHKIGKLYKFRISEVDKWVESGASANIE